MKASSKSEKENTLTFSTNLDNSSQIRTLRKEVGLINRNDKTFSTTGRNICLGIKLYMKGRRTTVSTASRVKTPALNVSKKTQETKASTTRCTETS